MEKPIDRRNVVTIGAVFDVLEPYRLIFGEGLYQEIRRAIYAVADHSEGEVLIEAEEAFALRVLKGEAKMRRKRKFCPKYCGFCTACPKNERKRGKYVEEKEKTCATCKHVTLPSGIEPCCSCIDYRRWEPKDSEMVTAFDPGAPEGDKTNVRLDWGERGPEIFRQARITPEDITSANQFSGTLVETARAVMKQITRLDYAIAGVRSKIASIGIKFTDKDLSRDEIAFMVGQLNALQADLFELEEERERKLRGAADVEFKDRDS